MFQFYFFLVLLFFLTHIFFSVMCSSSLQTLFFQSSFSYLSLLESPLGKALSLCQFLQQLQADRTFRVTSTHKTNLCFKNMFCAMVGCIHLNYDAHIFCILLFCLFDLSDIYKYLSLWQICSLLFITLLIFVLYMFMLCHFTLMFTIFYPPMY